MFSVFWNQHNIEALKFSPIPLIFLYISISLVMELIIREVVEGEDIVEKININIPFILLTGCVSQK